LRIANKTLGRRSFSRGWRKWETLNREGDLKGEETLTAGREKIVRNWPAKCGQKKGVKMGVKTAHQKKKESSKNGEEGGFNA